MRTNNKYSYYEKGQAAVEFGIILPALIILILAVVVYGRPYYQKIVAQNIAYSDCSAASRTVSSELNSSSYATGQLAASSSLGVGSSINLSGGYDSSVSSGKLENVKCVVLLSTPLALYDSGGDLSGVMKGVAVFFSAPFLSLEVK